MSNKRHRDPGAGGRGGHGRLYGGHIHGRRAPHRRDVPGQGTLPLFGTIAVPTTDRAVLPDMPIREDGTASLAQLDALAWCVKVMKPNNKSPEGRPYAFLTWSPKEKILYVSRLAQALAEIAPPSFQNLPALQALKTRAVELIALADRDFPPPLTDKILKGKGGREIAISAINRNETAEEAWQQDTTAKLGELITTLRTVAETAKTCFNGYDERSRDRAISITTDRSTNKNEPLIVSQRLRTALEEDKELPAQKLFPELYQEAAAIVATLNAPFQAWAIRSGPNESKRLVDGYQRDRKALQSNPGATGYPECLQQKSAILTILCEARWMEAAQNIMERCGQVRNPFHSALDLSGGASR